MATSDLFIPRIHEVADNQPGILARALAEILTLQQKEQLLKRFPVTAKGENLEKPRQLLILAKLIQNYTTLAYQPGARQLPFLHLPDANKFTTTAQYENEVKTIFTTLHQNLKQWKPDLPEEGLRLLLQNEVDSFFNTKLNSIKAIIPGLSSNPEDSHRNIRDLLQQTYTKQNKV